MKQMNNDREMQLEAMLRQLPETVENGLGGLTAGPHLKARIQLAATEPKKAPKWFSLARFAPIACGAAALALCVALGVGTLPGQPDPLIDSGVMGDPTAAPRAITADLNQSSVFISPSNHNPSYRSNWAPATGGSFPLVGVNGRYYRLVTTPRNVPADLIGNSLGSVAEFTMEPSLSGTNTVISNAVAFGKNVYEIRGMGGTLVTAEVDGQMRLFQRVSFNGNALRGREKLEDTLEISGQVIGMELTGVGTITDPAVCQMLLNTLFDCASYESSGSVSSKQSLLLELNNGLVLQMAVKHDSLAACGVWSCPEFFEAFEDACE